MYKNRSQPQIQAFELATSFIVVHKSRREKKNLFPEDVPLDSKQKQTNKQSTHTEQVLCRKLNFLNICWCKGWQQSFSFRYFTQAAISQNWHRGLQSWPVSPEERRTTEGFEEGLSLAQTGNQPLFSGIDTAFSFMIKKVGFCSKTNGH